jgi:penicillin-binding protein 1A
VEPLAIRYVEDRNGKLILEPEKELRSAQMRAVRAQQIMTPQEAYIMVSLLQSTVSSGTLRYAASTVGGFDRPIAGKTGTTQNWSDAWTVGFTPQVTTAVWFGFDERGYSLGINQTGATSAGPAWAEYMKQALADEPAGEFVRPSSGLLEVTVCAKSGLLPTKYCTEGTVREIFLTGTEPREFCDLHRFEFERNATLKENLKESFFSGDTLPQDLTIPDLGLEDLQLEPAQPGAETPDREPGAASTQEGNPLLD